MAEPRGDAGALSLAASASPAAPRSPEDAQCDGAQDGSWDHSAQAVAPDFSLFVRVKSGVSNTGVVDGTRSERQSRGHKSPLCFALRPDPASMDEDFYSDSEAEDAEAGAPRSKAAAAGGARLCGETKRALQRLTDAWPGQPVADADLATFCDLWGLDTTRARAFCNNRRLHLRPVPAQLRATLVQCRRCHRWRLTGRWVRDLSTFDCRDLDLLDPFYGCEVEPEAPEGELREEQARVLALRAAALLGPQAARVAGKRRVNKAAPRWLISPLHAEALHAVAELRRVAAAPSIADVEEGGEADPAAGADASAATKKAKGVKRPRRAPFSLDQGPAAEHARAHRRKPDGLHLQQHNQAQERQEVPELRLAQRVLQRADQPSVQLHLLVQALGQRIRSWQQPVVLAPAVVEAAQGALGAWLWSRPIYSLRRRLLLLELLKLCLWRRLPSSSPILRPAVSAAPACTAVNGPPCPRPRPLEARLRRARQQPRRRAQGPAARLRQPAGAPVPPP